MKYFSGQHRKKIPKKGYIYFFIFTNNIKQLLSDSNSTLQTIPKNKMCGVRGIFWVTFPKWASTF